MLLSTVLLALSLYSPADLRVVADTVRPPKPPPTTPRAARGKPATERAKPALAPKAKPVGEPRLKRRKPPG